MFAIPGSPGAAVRKTQAVDRPLAKLGKLSSLLAASLLAGLVLFHGYLLWQRIASTTLLEPMVALRWGAAALLLVGFAYLQRSGISLIRGHRALVLWLLVLLLHAGMVPAAEGLRPLAEPELLLAATLWGFALREVFGALGRQAGDGTPRFALARARYAPRPQRSPDYLESLSPRPPPAA